MTFNWQLCEEKRNQTSVTGDGIEEYGQPIMWLTPVPENFIPIVGTIAAGEPIQSTYPDGRARFLNAEEIAAIKNKSDLYKAEPIFAKSSKFI